jgi:hypothetical protein
LTINKTLRMVVFSVQPVRVRDVNVPFGAQSYEAFSAMLRINTSIVLQLPVFETAGADERVANHYHQMVIEQRLNKAGRGKLLSSSLTTSEEYVDALHELNTFSAEDSSAFQVSCLYSLLRLKPSVACMR